MKKIALSLACLFVLAASFHAAPADAADRIHVAVRFGAFRGYSTRTVHRVHIGHPAPVVVPHVYPWSYHQPSYLLRHGDHFHVEPARRIHLPVRIAPPVYRIYPY